MNRFNTHAVLRGFITLCRLEHYTNHEPHLIRWQAGHKMTDALANHWGKTPDEVFTAGVVEHPGDWVVKIICSELRRKLFDQFGVEYKSVIHFDGDGNIKIPRGCDFIVPKYNGNLIEQFRFYRIYSEGIKEINL